MASTSMKKETRRPMHVHVLYTLPPLAGTTFARSRTTVLVKPHAQAKGCKERWGSCELGDIVKAVCATSPNLLPNSRTDHSLFIQNPKQTHRESLYPSDPSQPAQPIEVHSGLVGWALDDASTESHSMIMGILRKDEVEEGEEEDSEDEAEEWLEVRMRLVKADPISHAQHMSQLTAFQQGLPFTSPSKRAPPPPPVQPVASSSSAKRSHPTPPTSASTPALVHSPPPNAFASSSTSHFRHESAPSRFDSDDREPVFKRPRLESGDSQLYLPTETQPNSNGRRQSVVETPSAVASSTPAPQDVASTPAGPTEPCFESQLQSLLRTFQSSSSADGYPPEVLALLKKLHAQTDMPQSDDAMGILSSMIETAERQEESKTKALVTKKGKGKAAATKKAVKAEKKAPASDPVGPSRTGRVAKEPKSGGYAGKKDKGEIGNCAVCGRTKSSIWRAKDGKANGPRICNACGLYWNKHKKDRPPELWKMPDASPVRRKKTQPKTEREYRAESRFLMTSPAQRRTTGKSVHGGSPSSNKKSPFHTMTSPMRGKNGWDFKAGPSSQAGDKLKALTQGGSPASKLGLGESAKAISSKKHLGLDPTKKDESPRKALKRMLSVGGEVELRRLKGPLSDDDSHQNEQHEPQQELTRGVRSPFKSHRTRMASNLSSGTSGLAFEDDSRQLHAGQTEIDQDWLGSDFSTLFDLDAASTAAGPLSDAGYGTDIDMALDHHSLDGGEGVGLVHHDGSEEPTFNLQLSSDNHNELLSQTMFTSSPNSSHHSLSQHGGSSPLTLPFDFSSLPPSSPPVIPPGLFSSPPGEDELLDLDSPIFSILGATPTAEETRSNPGSTTKKQPYATSVPSNLNAAASGSGHVHDPNQDMTQYINSPPPTSSSPHDVDHHDTPAANGTHPTPAGGLAVEEQDLQASFHAFFGNMPESSTTTSTQQSFDPALLGSSGVEAGSSSTQTTSPPTEAESSKVQQEEFLRLWGQCEEVMGKKNAGVVVPGSDAAEPSWVTD